MYQFMFITVYLLSPRHLFVPALNPYGSFRNWTTPQGQINPSMWNSTASSVPQPHGMGGFVSGCDPTRQSVQQQQGQSQTQIDVLRQQNSPDGPPRRHSSCVSYPTTPNDRISHFTSTATPPLHASIFFCHSFRRASTMQFQSVSPLLTPVSLLKKMSKEIAEKLTSSVHDFRDEDNQRRAEDLRALRERQLPESTQPPKSTPPSATPATGASLPPSSMRPPPIPAPPPLHPSTVSSHSGTHHARSSTGDFLSLSTTRRPLWISSVTCLFSQVPVTRSSKSHHHRHERPRSPSCLPQASTS